MKVDDILLTLFPFMTLEGSAQLLEAQPRWSILTGTV